MNYSQSSQLLERAKKVLAGGVSSEFRKYSYPHALFYSHGKGSRIWDVDGNEFLDFSLSQGPLILGHSNPFLLKSVEEYSEKGQLFAGQHIKEIELAEKLNELIPSAELMRFCLDGSEAVQTALRVSRAVTGRKKFLRFEGHYHGWMDNVSWGISTPSEEALGSRENPNVFPWTKGLPEHTEEQFILLPWNDLSLVKKTVAARYEEIAAIITEPIMCNNGCILPEKGFLQGLRELCNEYGIALIFDEVITGFRIGLGGAQKYFGITPDISVFAKAMASGYPISAVVGKRKWMKVVEESQVIQAGTMNTSNPTVAAGLATIETLQKENPYERLFFLGKKLMEGIWEAAKATKQNLLVQGPGPMFNTSFTNKKSVKDYRDTLSGDKDKLKKFISGMQEENIRIIGRGLWYISTAHTEKDILYTIEKAHKVLRNI
ncbi:MAG TPA: aspartate aminotransferase family protein [Hanamia sp.]|nr:aspartate aminotransferase family protein [Hanamia sp.]